MRLKPSAQGPKIANPNTGCDGQEGAWQKEVEKDSREKG